MQMNGWLREMSDYTRKKKRSEKRFFWRWLFENPEPITVNRETARECRLYGCWPLADNQRSFW